MKLSDNNEAGKNTTHGNIFSALFTGLIGGVIGAFISYAYVNNQQPDYHTVGETAIIGLPQVGMSYLSRIDTGARISSLHVVEYSVDGEPLGEGVSKSAHIGRNIRFVTLNEHKHKATYQTPVVDVASVRNAQGTEVRYVVELDLEWQGVSKRVRVNLRDRSAMTYKLLIGRNWLEGDYVVDVTKAEGNIK